MKRKLYLILAALLWLFAASGEEAERAVCYPSELTLECWETAKEEIVVLPQSGSQDVVLLAEHPEVLQAETDGTVTALEPGFTRVQVLSPEGKELGGFEVTVVSGIPVTALSFAEAETEMTVGDTLVLEPLREPEDASRAVRFETSDETVASVDRFGRVTAVSEGQAVISVCSMTDKNVRAEITLTVKDPAKIEKITSPLEGGIVLNVGDIAFAQASVLPETALPTIEYESSRPDIVTVEEGVITAVRRGFSVITVRDTTNPETFLAFRVYVDDGTCAVTVPLRRTDESGIEENLKLIEEMHESALQVVNDCESRGAITAREAKDRRNILERAFSMYAFPWTVEEKVEYWRAANSEEGAKDFQPGTIYYGLPYISGYNASRLYNVERALADGKYVLVPDKPYYVMVPNEDWGYAGNDCSAFVSIALWNNTSFNGETIKTYTLFNDTRLQIFWDTEELKPGDILVWHSTHVIMFLYWADEDHTQAVILQQGGDEPAINTVNAVIEEITDYTEHYYQPRRLADFRFYWRLQ